MKRIWIFSLVLALVLTAVGTPVSGKHYSGWALPSKLVDISSTTFSDTCPALTKDGLSLYFVSGATLPKPRDLYVSQRTSVDEPWGLPQKLKNTLINTADEERCPYVTPDGRRLIFIRQIGSLDDFYMSTRHDKNDDQGWGDPEIITALSIDSPGTDYGVWGFEDEGGKLTLYFGSRRINNQLDIYQTTMDSEGNFTTPVPVNELNTTASDYFPVVRKDGLEIYVTSNRTGTLGGQDIWVSTRNNTSEKWSVPVNLGSAINSTDQELRAALTWDGMNMVFASNKGGGPYDYDLYKSQRTKVTGAKE